MFHGSLSTCCRLLHEDTHFWSWTGKESWLWILLKMNGYIFGEHNSWPHHDGRGEYFVGRTWLDCLSEPCWRRCGATWFWLCPKIITFWEDVHLVTVRILDYDFTKSCVLLSLAIWRGSWWLAENGEWNVCHGAADSWDKNLRKRKVGWMAGPHIHNRIRTITPTSSQGQAVETWQSSLFLFSCFLSFNITSIFVLGLEIKYWNKRSNQASVLFNTEHRAADLSLKRILWMLLPLFGRRSEKYGDTGY